MALTAGMRALWRGSPLRIKLGVLLWLSTGMTTVFAMVAALGVGWWSTQRWAHEHVSHVASALATTVQAPLTNGNQPAVQEALAALRVRPQIKGAWVYDRDGRLLASWGSEAAAPLASRSGLAAGVFEQSAPVRPVEGAAALGRVDLRLDLRELRTSLLVQGVAALAGGLIGLLLSLLISRILVRHVTKPIVDMAQAASGIALGQAYDRRLPAAADDEVGAAVAAFNAMIDEVQQRGDALSQANRVLEGQVSERTLAVRRAEAASVAKTRFLANMSHELRTPLNGVIGAAQLLQDFGANADRRKELVEIIHRSGSNLLGLIDSILDLTRIETGALEFAPQDFNLLDCVEAVLATAAIPARGKGLHLACVIDPQLALWRHGDPLRVRQVLLNLMANAVKFTLRGEVVLRVGPGPAPHELLFRVSDSGIGMASEAAAAIFEPFRQGDESTTRRFGGSGLGLTICREIAHSMGGSIDVQSEPGQGSCFSVTLPLPQASRPGKSPAPLGFRIAFYEPHEPSAEALGALLARMGCEARRIIGVGELEEFMPQNDAHGRQPWLLVATDAPAAFDVLEAAAAWVEPERVIGMTLAEWYAADAEREHLRMPRSVIKPVLRSALVSRFGAADAPAAPQRDAADGEPTQGLGRVLVVEDDPVNQAIVSAMLGNAGFLTVVAGDGREALQLFAETGFDLVLMDWQMPDMDGLEVTRRLRAGMAGAAGKTVPIVALTANAFAEDRQVCLAAGMNDFLTKPVLATELARTVKRWILAARAHQTSLA